MRSLLSILFSAVVLASSAAVCTVKVTAPSYHHQPVVLYRIMDHVTERRDVVQVNDAPGDTAVFSVDVNDVTKAVLRIGSVNARFFLVPGAAYTVEFPAPSATQARSIGGATVVDLVFAGLDILDVNALVSDLNTRLDAFLAEGLATNEEAGMNAVQRAREQPKDSVRGSTPPLNLSVLPAPSRQRVDTFEVELRHFYAGVKDPWFWHYLDYSIAGLRFSPRTDARLLFDRYIGGKPVHYDDPEQLRFLQNFFGEHLMSEVFRVHDDRLRAVVAGGVRDSLDRLFRDHPFLANDAPLRELVMIMELYAHANDPAFDRKGIEAIIAAVKEGSTTVAHRSIAANMMWDLTWMQVGSPFPDLEVRTVDGSTVRLTDLLEGPACIAVTAGWCTWCEVEMEALEKLDTEHGAMVNFLVLSLDSNWRDFTALRHQRPAQTWTWLYAGDDPLFMDRLRLRAVPAFFLLNNGTVAQNPAPLPSQGMAAVFHKMKVEADERNRIKFGNEPPPPRR